MLSRKAKYGIRALIHLAERRGQGLIRIESIARAERIPRRFLEAILVKLKTDGLVRSRPGPAGGYLLSTPPAEVNLAQIIRLLDGLLAPVPCVNPASNETCDGCLNEKSCLVRVAIKEVWRSTELILERTTLETLLSWKGRQQILEYQI